MKDELLLVLAPPEESTTKTKQARTRFERARTGGSGFDAELGNCGGFFWRYLWLSNSKTVKSV